MGVYYNLSSLGGWNISKYKRSSGKGASCETPQNPVNVAYSPALQGITPRRMLRLWTVTPSNCSHQTWKTCDGRRGSGDSAGCTSKPTTQGAEVHQGAMSSQGDEAQGSTPALTASFVSSPTKGTSRTPGYFAVWPWGPCLHEKKESIRELILKF